jgi:hypothetical protein
MRMLTVHSVFASRLDSYEPRLTLIVWILVFFHGKHVLVPTAVPAVHWYRMRNPISESAVTRVPGPKIPGYQRPPSSTKTRSDMG